MTDNYLKSHWHRKCW